MIGLTIAFIAMSVFGVGVTIVDVFGALGQADDGGHDSAHDGSAHDGGHDSAHDGSVHDYSTHDAGHDAPGHDGSAHDGAHDLSHDGNHHGSSDDRHLPALSRGAGGSLMAAGNRGVRNVARLTSALRTIVYFCLGAGPMGLFASLRGQGLAETILWALIAGFLIAVIARTLRKAVRKGLIGKARIRKYGREMDVYVRLRSGSAAKGELVRLEERRGGEYLAAKAGADGLFS